ncbi:MAG: hypothetical protein LBJ72_01360, partial [Dysgonamonadaceae bacterium]|nr:hypothetical protein [Dysgonamonadaceae bacterium]
MKHRFIAFFLIFLPLISASAKTNAVPLPTFKEDFSKPLALKTVGRGNCSVTGGVLVSKDAYACFGNPELTDYSIEFKARTPEQEEQV